MAFVLCVCRGGDGLMKSIERVCGEGGAVVAATFTSELVARDNLICCTMLS